jgi:prophage antirepressor-like protein
VDVGFDYEDEGEDLVSLQKVYEKFLIGTEVCEILEVNNYEQQQTLARVAATHPTSLQQLREVQNGSYISASMIYAGNQPEIDDLFEDCFKVQQICNDRS